MNENHGRNEDKAYHEHNTYNENHNKHKKNVLNQQI